jgi:hypothetical protein
VTVYEQTVVVLARTTAFTVVCQACAADGAGEHLAHTAQGRLRLEDHLSWTTCPHGHRIRVIRAGAAVHAEATSPLW